MSAEIVGRYVEVDGNRTFYDECGEGTPVVCVHTAGADSREYQYLLPLLAERGYRGLALDLPATRGAIRSTGNRIGRSTSTPSTSTASPRSSAAARSR